MRYSNTIFVAVGIFVLSSAVAHAEFVALSSGLPGGIGRALFAGGLPKLLNTLIGISVAVAATLAVIMIAVGGFKYMTTDSMFAMGNAKEQITNAIVGLLIVLAAILILKTINPCLVTMNVFSATNETCANTYAP